MDTGRTSSGKSTGLPVMLIDPHTPPNPTSRARTTIRMFVAQPRRIAVHGLYRRLKPQLGSRVGMMMGHGVREIGRDTQILYATTGSLLLKMAFHPELMATHQYLIIDEGTVQQGRQG